MRPFEQHYLYTREIESSLVGSVGADIDTGPISRILPSASNLLEPA
jgi:hypothetical protein